MDFKSEFIGYSLDTCGKADYRYKSRVKRNNDAMIAIQHLVDAHKADAAFLEEQLGSLLQHENEKVRLMASWYCYELGLNKKQARKVLRAIKWKSSDKMLAFSASMILSGGRV